MCFFGKSKKEINLEMKVILERYKILTSIRKITEVIQDNNQNDDILKIAIQGYIDSMLRWIKIDFKEFMHDYKNVAIRNEEFMAAYNYLLQIDNSVFTIIVDN
jgi:hypothetical protein